MSARTIYEKFIETAGKYPDRPFLNVTPGTADAYGIAAGEISYGDMQRSIDDRAQSYRKSNYTEGHRVGLLLENRPAFIEHWFALNALGVSVVPINPDLRSSELRYLIDHSEQCLVVAIESRINDLKEIFPDLAIVSPDELPPLAPSDILDGSNSGDEAALLYTSGTTGSPKGCVLSNHYFLNCGRWYNAVGGHCTLKEEGERMLTPLPLYHMNAMACSVMAMIEVGGCLSVLDRFHPSSWWAEVAQARATIVHYLGVMPAILMNMPDSPSDKSHNVRFGFGAGVERTLHADFEKRYGFPLIEGWAMTETGLGAVLCAFEEPRHVGTNCCGKPQAEVAVKIVDDMGNAVPQGDPGELLVRHNGADTRQGFFDRYLKDDAATELAWADGWFHTGDILRENNDGTLVFVDRKKNVIRRSGENISAVEVENVLNQHSAVAVAGVAAVPDPIRGDEVFACIVTDTKITPEELSLWCREQLAYYKAPGFVAFVDALPVTATNKINRGKLDELAAQLHKSNECTDLRHLKKRTSAE